MVIKGFRELVSFIHGVPNELLERAAKKIYEVSNDAVRQAAEKTEKELKRTSRKKNKQQRNWNPKWAKLTGTRRSSYKSKELKSLRLGIDNGKSSVQNFGIQFNNKNLAFKYEEAAIFFQRIVSRTPIDEDYQYSTKKTNELRRQAKGFSLKKYKDGHTEMRPALARGDHLKWHRADDEVAREKWEITFVNTEGPSLTLSVNELASCSFDTVNSEQEIKKLTQLFMEINQNRDFCDIRIKNDSPYIDVLEFGRYSKGEDVLDAEGVNKGDKHYHGVISGYSVQAPRGMVRLTDVEFETARIKSKEEKNNKNYLAPDEIIDLGNVAFKPANMSIRAGFEMDSLIIGDSLHGSVQKVNNLFSEEEITNALLHWRPTVAANVAALKDYERKIKFLATYKGQELRDIERHEKKSRKQELDRLKQDIIGRARQEFYRKEKEDYSAVESLIKEKEYKAALEAAQIYTQKYKGYRWNVLAKKIEKLLNQNTTKKDDFKVHVNTEKTNLSKNIIEVIDRETAKSNYKAASSYIGKTKTGFYIRLLLVIENEDDDKYDERDVIVKVDKNNILVADTPNIKERNLAILLKQNLNFMPIEKYINYDIEDYENESIFSSSSLLNLEGQLNTPTEQKRLIHAQFNLFKKALKDIEIK